MKPLAASPSYRSPPRGISSSERDDLAFGVLTEREVEGVQLIATLFISESSVKAHLIHVYNTLGVRDRAAAVAEAFRRGIAR